MTVPSKSRVNEMVLTTRPGIEEETVLLNEMVDLARKAADGQIGGSTKPSESNVILGAGRLIGSVVKQHMANRIARARLVAQEAKTIDQDAAA